MIQHPLRAEKARRDGKREGRVTALTQRGLTEVIGRFEALGKGGRVVPEDERLGMDLFVAPPK